jgi:hypothetical protein
MLLRSHSTWNQPPAGCVNSLGIVLFPRASATIGVTIHRIELSNARSRQIEVIAGSLAAFNAQQTNENIHQGFRSC